MIHEDLDWGPSFLYTFFSIFSLNFLLIILYSLYFWWLITILSLYHYIFILAPHWCITCILHFFIVLSIFLNPKQYITLMLSSNSVSTFGYTWDVFRFDQLFNVCIKVLDLKIFWPEGLLRHQLSKCSSGAVKLEIFLLFIILIVLFNCELKFNFFTSFKLRRAGSTCCFPKWCCSISLATWCSSVELRTEWMVLR